MSPHDLSEDTAAYGASIPVIRPQYAAGDPPPDNFVKLDAGPASKVNHRRRKAEFYAGIMLSISLQ